MLKSLEPVTVGRPLQAGALLSIFLIMSNQQAHSTSKFDEAIGAVIKLLNDGKQEWQQIRNSLDTIKKNHQRLTDKVCQLEDWSRKPFTKSTIKTYLEVIHRYFNGLCPCCSEHLILSDAGIRLESLEIDHFKGPKWNKTTEGWPICESCHNRLTHGYLSRDGWVYQAFQAFQMRVCQYIQLENGQMQIF